MKAIHKERLTAIIAELNDIAARYNSTHVAMSLSEAIDSVEEALCIIRKDEDEEDQ